MIKEMMLKSSRRRIIVVLWIAVLCCAVGWDCYAWISHKRTCTTLQAHSRALDISIASLNEEGDDSQEYEVAIQTNQQRYYTSLNRPGMKPSRVVVDLFSTLHIGQVDYYQSLTQSLSNYDIVLYELITSRENVVQEENKTYKRRLTRALYAKNTEELAQRFRLSHQLTLPLLEKKNWYIADLDIESIQVLESKNQGNILSKYWLSLLAGRNVAYPFLKNFYLPDQWLLFALRFFAWLTPCPELNCLLIDWSRMSPIAGGIAPILFPMLTLVSRGKLAEVQKLAFSQQLLSGIPDAGAWGGESQSDIEVRISSRNRECCRVVNAWLDEIRRNSSNVDVKEVSIVSRNFSIAILYGAYHIEDLSKRLVEDVKLTLDTGYQPKTYTAWTISTKQASQMVDSSSPTERNIFEKQFEKQSSLSSLSLLSSMNLENNILFTWMKQVDQKNLLYLGVGLVLYLVVGALDWWVVLRLLELDLSSASSIQPLLDTAQPDGNTVLEIAKMNEEKWNLFSLSGFYLVLYVQRHLFLLRKISYVGIQWDRGLFAELFSPSTKQA